LSQMLLVQRGGQPLYRVDQTDFELAMEAWRDGGTYDSVARDLRDLGYRSDAARIAMHARQAVAQECEIATISASVGSDVPTIKPQEGTR